MARRLVHYNVHVDIELQIIIIVTFEIYLVNFCVDINDDLACLFVLHKLDSMGYEKEGHKSHCEQGNYKKDKKLMVITYLKHLKLRAPEGLSEGPYRSRTF